MLSALHYYHFSQKNSKNISKWFLQILTQEKALGKTSNLSTLRTTGSDIFSKYWPVPETKIVPPIGTNFCAKLDTRNLHPNQEFSVQYFGDKFGTRLFQTVTNFQLNFEPFRRSFLTQKFSATWLQIMKQFFKLFHNFKTGLWTKNCKQFFKSMVNGPWHNFNQNRVPPRFQYFQYFHVHQPYPKGQGPFNLTHKI